MFFLLYGDLTNEMRETNTTKAKDRNRDVIDDTTLTKVTYGKHATRVPDEVTYGIYEWFSSQLNTLLHIIKRTTTYSCFEKGCPTKANKSRRQCRKVLWVTMI